MKEECKYCGGWNDEKAECIGIGMYCATREKIEEEAAQARIADLNSISVEDWDCDSGEIVYIRVSDNESNRKILVELGATETDIDDMAIGTDGLLDITSFAFEHTDAEWWCNSRGFGNGDMPS
jgi:hypothetical protein